MARRSLAPQLAWPLSASDLREALGDQFERVRIVRVSWDKPCVEDPLSVSWPAENAEMPGWSSARPPGVWVRPVSRDNLDPLRDL